MYGGSGTVPCAAISANASPSTTTAIVASLPVVRARATRTTASPTNNGSPTLNCFLARAKHRQVSPTTPGTTSGSTKSSSTAPPVGRRAITRAGMTRVSLTTITAPGAAAVITSARSVTWPSCRSPRPAPTVSSRAPSREACGACAICAGGKSKA